MIANNLPNLAQFFSSYFHQDWHLDDTDADAVMRRYLEEESPAFVAQTIEEIEQLLGMNCDEAKLNHILTYDLGCYYNPAWQKMSNAEWLCWVHNSLKQGESSRLQASC